MPTCKPSPGQGWPSLGHMAVLATSKQALPRAGSGGPAILPSPPSALHNAEIPMDISGQEKAIHLELN